MASVKVCWVIFNLDLFLHLDSLFVKDQSLVCKNKGPTFFYGKTRTHTHTHSLFKHLAYAAYLHMIDM